MSKLFMLAIVLAMMLISIDLGYSIAQGAEPQVGCNFEVTNIKRGSGEVGGGPLVNGKVGGSGGYKETIKGGTGGVCTPAELARLINIARNPPIPVNRPNVMPAVPPSVKVTHPAPMKAVPENSKKKK